MNYKVTVNVDRTTGLATISDGKRTKYVKHKLNEDLDKEIDGFLYRYHHDDESGRVVFHYYKS